jgi:hypothetical protein
MLRSGQRTEVLQPVQTDIYRSVVQEGRFPRIDFIRESGKERNLAGATFALAMVLPAEAVVPFRFHGWF